MSGNEVSPQAHWGRIHGHRAKHGKNGPRNQSRRNWIVDDYRGPKVFVRRFTFSYFQAALNAANSLATTGLVDPKALFGVQRIEYSGLAS